MNKYIDFYAERNKRWISYKEEATAILLGVREKKFEVLNIKLERLITIQSVNCNVKWWGFKRERKNDQFPWSSKHLWVLTTLYKFTDVPITFITTNWMR